MRERERESESESVRERETVRESYPNSSFEAARAERALHEDAVQGYLAHKKTPPPRTQQ